MLVDSQVLPFPRPPAADDDPDGVSGDHRTSRPDGPLAHGFHTDGPRLAGGVAIVTTAVDGAWYGVATDSVCSLSVEPPLLITCIQRRSRVSRQLGYSRRFCVNLLSAEHDDVGDEFTGRHGVTRFRYGTWSESSTGAPVLHGTIASFECDVERLYGYPDSLVVTGSVQQVTNAAGTDAAMLTLPRQLSPHESSHPTT